MKTTTKLILLLLLLHLPLFYTILTQSPHQKHYIKSSFISKVEDIIIDEQIQELNDTIQQLNERF